MADNFANPYAAELMDLTQQQQLAKMLMQQGLQQPQSQMIGNQYVKASPLQYLANMANLYVGKKTEEQAAQKEKDLANLVRSEGLSDAQNIMQARQGTPAEMYPAQAGPTPTGGNIPLQESKAAIPGSDMAAYITALRGRSPVSQGMAQVLQKQLFAEPTPEEKRYKAAVADGSFKGGFNAFLTQMSDADKQRIALDRQRLGLEGARFGLEQQKALQELGGGKLTETQGNATGFGLRAKEANQIATGLEKQGVNIPGKTATVVGGIVGMTPFVGDKYAEASKSVFNVLPEFAGGLSPEQQQNAQARRNFISAVLRKESGAAISPQEYATEEKKYFPQMGEDASVIAQKQQARESAIRALELQAGPGARFIKEAGQAPTGGGWSVKSVK